MKHFGWNKQYFFAKTKNKRAKTKRKSRGIFFTNTFPKLIGSRIRCINMHLIWKHVLIDTSKIISLQNIPSR